MEQQQQIPETRTAPHSGKTDQREIREASGKQRACCKISPVSSRQISRRQRVSGVCFQFVRPRVKKPRQDQSPETQQGWSKQETKTRLIPAIKVKDQRHS